MLACVRRGSGCPLVRKPRQGEQQADLLRWDLRDAKRIQRILSEGRLEQPDGRLVAVPPCG